MNDFVSFVYFVVPKPVAAKGRKVRKDGACPYAICCGHTRASVRPAHTTCNLPLQALCFLRDSRRKHPKDGFLAPPYSRPTPVLLASYCHPTRVLLPSYSRPTRLLLASCPSERAENMGKRPEKWRIGICN